MSPLSGKHIVLGVTGSIAAYKAAPLVRLLVKAGAEVQVVMTEAAKAFITPLTLSTLSGRPVLSDFYDRDDGSWHSHVELGLWADLFVVAPATAATMSKMACGLADNFLVTSYLATRARVCVAPAMDRDMYAHPATQAAKRRLEEMGVAIIEAEEGELASHLMGKGRLPEPETIVRRLEELLRADDARRPLRGRRILLTSGPTYERIDPVRFIGNYSSGRMGKALAEEALALGAEVLFVTGPAPILPAPAERLHIVPVESADEMLEACRSAGPYDIGIFCAAVADYKVAHPAREKVKREQQPSLSLELVSNPDIAALMGEQKRPGQLHIGFALESRLVPEQVRDKMRRKNFDLIVANSLEDEGAGFGTETNRVRLLSRDGKVDRSLPLLRKEEVARAILETLSEL